MIARWVNLCKNGTSALFRQVIKHSDQILFLQAADCLKISAPLISLLEESKLLKTIPQVSSILCKKAPWDFLESALWQSLYDQIFRKFQ